MNMKWITKISLAVAALTTASGMYSAQAAFYSFPRALKLQLETIRLETPTLAPLAYSRFCITYPEDCRAPQVVFRGPRPVVLTAERAQDLIEVNREVNREITPRADAGTVIDEHWRIAPQAGACHDYAVTKRHELLAKGWPARSLLLAEVIVPWGEHHLVLVVRTNAGDVVLDNLTASIRSWSRAPYQWVRVQSPSNPNNWMTAARKPSPGEYTPAADVSSLGGPTTTLGKG
jgi:predicted transglutaminase-like cysteine proteinase